MYDSTIQHLVGLLVCCTRGPAPLSFAIPRASSHVKAGFRTDLAGIGVSAASLVAFQPLVLLLWQVYRSLSSLIHHRNLIADFVLLQAD